MNQVEKNDVLIVRTPVAVAVATRDAIPRTLTVELIHQGMIIKREEFNSFQPWKESIDGIDMLRCGVRVMENNVLLAALESPDIPHWMSSFMVRQGEQVHITESYISIPPALLITDSVAAERLLQS